MLLICFLRRSTGLARAVNHHLNLSTQPPECQQQLSSEARCMGSLDTAEQIVGR